MDYYNVKAAFLLFFPDTFINITSASVLLHALCVHLIADRLLAIKDSLLWII